MPQEGFAFGGADAADAIQRRAEPLFGAQTPVVGDRKTVRLVAHALQQEQRGRVGFEDDRVLAAGQEYTLRRTGDFLGKRGALGSHLGEADHVDLVDRQLAQHLDRDPELALAAVHDQQVGQVVLGHGARVPPRQDLVHHAEVVRALDRLDAEAAVALLVRLALVEDDHRAHRQIALDVGDVETLDAFRRVAQAQGAAQAVQRLFLVLLAAPFLDEAVAGVLFRHFHQAEFVPAPRAGDADLLPLAFGQDFAAHRGVFERERQQDFVRNEPAALIELAEQFGEHLIVGKFVVVEAVALVADQLAAAHEQDLDFDQPALAVQAEDVLIGAERGGDLLFFRGLGHRPDLVAQPRRGLEAQRLRRGGHARFEFIDELRALAFEQQQRVLDLGTVVGGIDRQRARAETALDLIFQARPGAVTEHAVRTRPQRKDLADGFQRVLDRGARMERPEIFGAVFDHLARQQQPRPRVPLRQLDVPVRGIVLEADVVAGLELLDQRVFEQQRLFFVPGDQRLHVVHPGEQEPDMRAPVPAAGVLPDPGAEVLRLSDVDDRPVLVREFIDAGGGGQGRQPGFESRGWGVGGFHSRPRNAERAAPRGRSSSLLRSASPGALRDRGTPTFQPRGPVWVAVTPQGLPLPRRRRR